MSPPLTSHEHENDAAKTLFNLFEVLMKSTTKGIQPFSVGWVKIDLSNGRYVIVQASKFS